VFEALNVLFPQDLYYAKVLSFIYLQVEEYEKALEQAERLIRQTKDKEELAIGFFYKGKACWGLGQTQKAQEHLEHLKLLQTGKLLNET
jgi:tetratricopeptide (TPR) repeat protein